jgi:hypothetical protein
MSPSVTLGLSTGEFQVAGWLDRSRGGAEPGSHGAAGHPAAYEPARVRRAGVIGGSSSRAPPRGQVCNTCAGDSAPEGPVTSNSGPPRRRRGVPSRPHVGRTRRMPAGARRLGTGRVRGERARGMRRPSRAAPRRVSAPRARTSITSRVRLPRAPPSDAGIAGILLPPPAGGQFPGAPDREASPPRLRAGSTGDEAMHTGPAILRDGLTRRRATTGDMTSRDGTDIAGR